MTPRAARCASSGTPPAGAGGPSRPLPAPDLPLLAPPGPRRPPGRGRGVCTLTQPARAWHVVARPPASLSGPGKAAHPSHCMNRQTLRCARPPCGRPTGAPLCTQRHVNCEATALRVGLGSARARAARLMPARPPPSPVARERALPPARLAMAEPGDAPGGDPSGHTPATALIRCRKHVCAALQPSRARPLDAACGKYLCNRCAPPPQSPAGEQPPAVQQSGNRSSDHNSWSTQADSKHTAAPRHSSARPPAAAAGRCSRCHVAGLPPRGVAAVAAAAAAAAAADASAAVAVGEAGGAPLPAPRRRCCSQWGFSCAP